MKHACAGALLILAAMATSSPAWALEYGSAARPSILYEGPASSATKVAVISAGYPLEKIVASNGWVKVRDETGALAWLQESAFSTKRTVLVSAPLAYILEKPLDGSAGRFRAEHGVMLDLIAPAEGGWVKVRHISGQEGYAKIRDVWGL